MLPNDEVRLLRRDLDEVKNRTEDISRRLDTSEARYREGVPAVVPTGGPAREQTAPAAPIKTVTGLLHDAARHGDIALAERCIDEGADVNEVIRYQSALDVAVEVGQPEMAELLVANGARDETLGAITRAQGLDFKRAECVLAPIALATGLPIVLLNRIPHLANANLSFITIGSFALAAVLFVLSLIVRQRFYRYAGLAVIVLSLARLFLIDMKEQDPSLHVAAFAVVGAGLLCISVGYYKWMARARLAQSKDFHDEATEGSADAHRGGLTL